MVAMMQTIKLELLRAKMLIATNNKLSKIAFEKRSPDLVSKVRLPLFSKERVEIKHLMFKIWM